MALPSPQSRTIPPTLPPLHAASNRRPRRLPSCPCSRPLRILRPPHVLLLYFGNIFVHQHLRTGLKNADGIHARRFLCATKAPTIAQVHSHNARDAPRSGAPIVHRNDDIVSLCKEQPILRERIGIPEYLVHQEFVTVLVIKRHFNVRLPRHICKDASFRAGARVPAPRFHVKTLDTIPNLNLVVVSSWNEGEVFVFSLEGFEQREQPLQVSKGAASYFTAP